MEETTRRPFYNEYAWAYDLLITPPIARQCDFIAEMLSRGGVHRGARILDAGCGTGKYAIELARRGYVVDGLDLSLQLISEARKHASRVALRVSFAVGDILALEALPQYDAVICRGVLNDLLDDSSRQEVFRSFARALRPRGLLIMDVREWSATVERKTREPVFERSLETERGKLTFRSVTELEHKTRRLLVTERHALIKDSVETHSLYDFQMRCWTRGELEACFSQAGFESIEYFGAYDSQVAVGASDRLVIVAYRTATV